MFERGRAVKAVARVRLRLYVEVVAVVTGVVRGDVVLRLQEVGIFVWDAISSRPAFSWGSRAPAPCIVRYASLHFDCAHGTSSGGGCTPPASVAHPRFQEVLLVWIGL